LRISSRTTSGRKKSLRTLSGRSNSEFPRLLRSTARITKARREPNQSPTSKMLNRKTQMRNVAMSRRKRVTKRRGRMREKN